MSDMQIAKQDQSSALVSANREEEVETTEETTLSEVRRLNFRLCKFNLSGTT